MNYKETNVTGASWTRCKTVVITNPLVPPINIITGAPMGPQAIFQEEEVLDLADGKQLLMDTTQCQKAFNPTDTITLLDPATGEATGETVTHGALYGILFSLYMQTALERDNAI